ncbi:hypothetical protein B0H17DRAFT_1126337 [Mycena rosella]|uniref:Nephrocystin 3-like N-terminal domain-containing protein n=1 Tax=Mycena rosella TaxID=1033263 RepID=A0AAD7M876_MYCRO|nr:hypothetical protein B0H17DRAFT_1126337 [Mycena rosella]
MPLFASSSGVQINGGNFYDVAGDMNIESALPLVPGRNLEPLMALQFGLTQGANRLLAGPERHERHVGTAKMLPYDISRRPEIHGHSHLPNDRHWYTSGSTILPSPHTERADPGSNLHRAIEYPTFTQPRSRQFGSYFSSDHPEWSLPASTALVSAPSNPAPSQHPDSLHSESRLPYCHSNTTGGASSSRNLPGAIDSQSDLADIPAFPSALGEPSLRSAALIGGATAEYHRQRESKTNISGGTFIGGNVNHVQRHGEPGLHILYRAGANDAAHDSGERYPQPRCHPETRTTILHDINAWSSEQDPSSSVLWLHGPAGAGKSAIAQSFCQKLEKEGRLGGSFFFKRGHASRGNGNKLFPTIAYQLALLLPELKRAISQRMEDDPALLDKALSTQLQRLVLEPYRDSSPTRTFVVIIDGLDECEGEHIQQEILRSIGSAANESHLPLRFLVASRPEPHIQEIFGEPRFNGFHRSFNIDKSFQDVRTYLQTEFIRIHRDHSETMDRVPRPWPPANVVEHLVAKSSGYFVYASTVIKFVDDKNFRPTDLLDVILGITEPDVGSGSPFGALDQLYTQILSAVPARPRLLRILCVISAGLHSALRVTEIEQLLELRPGDMRLTLRRLQSVIQLPVDDETTHFPGTVHNVLDGYRDPSLRVTVHHASFLDFLCNPTRSRTFYVAGVEHRTDLARQILKALSHLHTDSSFNKNGDHVAWNLDQAAIQIVTSVPPSLDLLSLLRHLNPDFLFYQSSKQFKVDLDQVRNWLKEVHPPPQDLIKLWEDYYFIRQFAYNWSPIPQFAVGYPPNGFVGIFDIRLWLDLSWDELRTGIADGERVLHQFLVLASTRELSLPAINNVVWRHSTFGWTRLLRLSPPCPDLMCEIDLVSAGIPFECEDLDNIVQWLESFPQAPSEMIKRFKKKAPEYVERWVWEQQTILARGRKKRDTAS